VIMRIKINSYISLLALLKSRAESHVCN